MAYARLTPTLRSLQAQPARALAPFACAMVFLVILCWGHGPIGLDGSDHYLLAPQLSMMQQCTTDTVVPPTIEAALLELHDELSEPEPLGLRTVVDGNYLPRVPKGHKPLCTPIMQRGHVVIYTPSEVRDILAGKGDFAGKMPPFAPTERAHPMCTPINVSYPAAPAASAPPGATRYSPVVLFADIGFGDGANWVENVALEWVTHTVFTPKDTQSFIVAIFFHRQSATDAFDMEAAREYLRIPGVVRAMSTYNFAQRGVESCELVQRLADVVQPHMLIATADEKATRHCTPAVLSQRCYGCDRHCGAGKCALPITIAEFSAHAAPGVAHVPTWTWPGAEPRAMRRLDAPAPAAGWNKYHGWPLPFASLPWVQGTPWAQAYERGIVCQQWEPKRVPQPPPGTYVNENLRPLDCYNITRHECLLAPPAEPLELKNSTCAPPPADVSQHWAFPPRYAHPFQPPPVERPRRLVWSLVGSYLYGDRATARDAFAREFTGLPGLAADRGFYRFEVLSRVVCDSVFVVIGGGNAGYETARVFEAGRCGAIPVIAMGTPHMSEFGVSKVPDAATAYTTLLGFERRWPDGWIVGVTWEEAATLARRALETPGEVQRLRRQVLATYAHLQESQNARTRLAVRRAAEPDHYWDEAAAARALRVQERLDLHEPRPLL